MPGSSRTGWPSLASRTGGRRSGWYGRAAGLSSDRARRSMAPSCGRLLWSPDRGALWQPRARPERSRRGFARISAHVSATTGQGGGTDSAQAAPLGLCNRGRDCGPRSTMAPECRPRISSVVGAPSRFPPLSLERPCEHLKGPSFPSLGRPRGLLGLAARPCGQAERSWRSTMGSERASFDPSLDRLGIFDFEVSSDNTGAEGQPLWAPAAQAPPPFGTMVCTFRRRLVGKAEMQGASDFPGHGGTPDLC